MVEPDVAERPLDLDRIEFVRDSEDFARRRCLDPVDEELDGDFGMLGATGGFPYEGDF